VNATLNSALYTVGGGSSAGTSSSTPGTATDLRFEYRDSSGVQAVKEYIWIRRRTSSRFTRRWSAGDRMLPVAVTWGPAVGDSLESSRLIQVAEGLLLETTTTTRLAPKDIGTQPTREGNFSWPVSTTTTS